MQILAFCIEADLHVTDMRESLYPLIATRTHVNQISGFVVVMLLVESECITVCQAHVM